MSEKSSKESGRDTQFWLIRHAESTWNAAGLWQGQADPPLSERGRFQAARLAEALAQERVEILITSDLVRTVETAEIVASRLALEAYRESGLRELDAGSWSGSSRQQIASRDGDLLARFDTGDVDVRAGGGECRREVASRARQVLAQWAAQHAGRRVAVVTHSGVIRSLLPDVRIDHARWSRQTSRRPETSWKDAR
ncbi:MAG: histidine phosphatase family protein [Myxococcales bacterium]|nr:histidine phosphatase family protein [Myxococcales bacterium]